MIVNKILLTNWGVFRDGSDLDLDENLNLIVGPNESGKSTTVDALRVAFFERHTSRSSRIGALVPWGSELSPKVSIVFEAGGVRYRTTKSFLRNAASVLERRKDAKWLVIADGDAADRGVVDLVGGKLGSHGTPKPEHWGLAQVLWSRQGEMLPEGGLNEDAKVRIQAMFKAMTLTEEEARIRQKIGKEFESVLTPSRRTYKSGSDLDGVMKEIDILQIRISMLNDKLAERERLSREVVDARKDLVGKTAQLKVADDVAATCRKQVKSADEHEKLRIGIESDVRDMTVKHKALHKQVDRMKSLEKDITRTKKQIGTDRNQIEIENDKLGKYAPSLAQKLKDVDQVHAKLVTKEDDLTVARQAWGILRDTIDMGVLLERLERVQELKKERVRIQRQLKGLKAPSEAEVAKLRNLSNQIDRTRAQLEAVGLTANLAAEAAIKGTVLLDDEEATFKLLSKASREWKATQSITLRLQDIGEFQVRSSSRDVKKLTANLKELGEEYTHGAKGYGSSDIRQLEAMSRQKSDLEKQADILDGRVRDTAGEPVVELENRAKACRERITTGWNKIPKNHRFSMLKDKGDTAQTCDEAKGIVESLEDDVKGLRKDESSLRGEIDKLRGVQDSLKQKISELESLVNSREGAVRQMDKELEALRSDGLSDKVRLEELANLGYELDRKKKTLEALTEEKKDKEDKPRAALEAAEKNLVTVRQLATDAEKNVSNLEGRLQQEAKEGTYADLAEMEEKLEDLQRRKKKLAVQVNAVALLYDLYEWHRSEATKSVIEPLTWMVSENAKKLVGPKYGLVKLNDDCLPVQVEVADWSMDVDVDVLSYGTREQLALLTRLALGEMLSKNERQLVILDDPLTNTHVSRLASAIQILQDASKKLQLVVLTCHPDRYAGLVDARVLAL